MSKESLTARALEIQADLKEFISEKQLERLSEAGIEGNSLPASGTFKGYKKAGEKDFTHVRIVVDDNNSISLSNLRIVAPMKGETPEFGTIAKEGALKGKKYLKGKSINPKFAQFSGIELIAYLEGKKFTAQPVEVQQLAFNAAGYSTDTEAKKALVVKGAYVVTIED